MSSDEDDFAMDRDDASEDSFNGTSEPGEVGVRLGSMKTKKKGNGDFRFKSKQKGDSKPVKERHRDADRELRHVERRRVLKKIKQIEKKMAGAEDGREKQFFVRDLEQYQLDLQYIAHYPKDRVYLPLYGHLSKPRITGGDGADEEISEKVKQAEEKERQKMRRIIREIVDGKLKVAPESSDSEAENEQPKKKKQKTNATKREQPNKASESTEEADDGQKAVEIEEEEEEDVVKAAPALDEEDDFFVDPDSEVAQKKASNRQVLKQFGGRAFGRKPFRGRGGSGTSGGSGPKPAQASTRGGRSDSSSSRGGRGGARGGAKRGTHVKF